MVKKKQEIAKDEEKSNVESLDSFIRGQEKQIKLVLLFMGVLIVSILFFYWFSIELKTFDYAGLSFEKTKMGELNLYYAEMPVSDVFGNIVSYQGFYFRNDPRELEEINMGDKIRLKNKVAIAAGEGFVQGNEDSVLAATSLSLFLEGTGISIFPATTNKTESEQTGRTYVDYQNSSYYSIVEFKYGNETKITMVKKDYYILEVSEKEDTMAVTERFILGLYANSRGINI